MEQLLASWHNSPARLDFLKAVLKASIQNELPLLDENYVIDEATRTKQHEILQFMIEIEISIQAKIDDGL